MSVAIARAGHTGKLRGANYAVLILVCATGSEAEAVEFRALFTNATEARLRTRTVVLVGRISEATLRHLGHLVKHVVALPATEKTQPGGSLWDFWKREHKGAQPWETLTLDWTIAPVDAKFADEERQTLQDMKIAEKIL